MTHCRQYPAEPVFWLATFAFAVILAYRCTSPAAVRNLQYDLEGSMCWGWGCVPHHSMPNLACSPGLYMTARAAHLAEAVSGTEGS